LVSSWTRFEHPERLVAGWAYHRRQTTAAIGYHRRHQHYVGGQETSISVRNSLLCQLSYCSEEVRWNPSDKSWLFVVSSGCRSSSQSEASDALLAPRQLWIGVGDGAEAAVRATRRYMENMERGQLLVKIDFKNAFKTLRRDVVLKAVGKLSNHLASVPSRAVGHGWDMHQGRHHRHCLQRLREPGTTSTACCESKL